MKNQKENINPEIKSLKKRNRALTIVLIVLLILILLLIIYQLNVPEIIYTGSGCKTLGG